MGLSTNTYKPFCRQAFEDAIFANVGSYRKEFGTNVAYASFLPLWTAIDESPGSFGLTSLQPCLINDSTTVGACDSPSTYIYWQHARKFIPNEIIGKL